MLTHQESARRIVVSFQHRDQRGLAGAGRTDQGDGCALKMRYFCYFDLLYGKFVFRSYNAIENPCTQFSSFKFFEALKDKLLTLLIFRFSPLITGCFGIYFYCFLYPIQAHNILFLVVTHPLNRQIQSPHHGVLRLLRVAEVHVVEGDIADHLLE